jgi:hypothetical protein
VRDRDLPGDDRLDQALHLGGQVLTVGVEGDDYRGPGVGQQPVSRSQRSAAAAIDHVAGDHRSVPRGDFARAVARAVVDDEHGRLDAAHLLRNAIEHIADARGFVVGGDEDADPVTEPIRMTGG